MPFDSIIFATLASMLNQGLFTESILALSLALDCFAIAISQGLRQIPTRSLIRLALCFGLFQGGLLLAGYLSSLALAFFFSDFMSWLAAGLLFWIGIKMIREGLEKDPDSENIGLSLKTYLLLSVATSIDAMAAGLTLSSLDLDVWRTALLVALCSFGLTLLGGHYGSKLGQALGQRAEVFGGLVLIGLGLKSLF